MDRSNHVFLFLSHSVSAQIIREYGNISSAIAGMGSSVFLYHDRRNETPPSLPRHKLYLFSDESLSNLNYLRIGPSLVPGHNQFPLLQFFRDNPDFDYYWVIEYDVRFSGHIEILDLYSRCSRRRRKIIPLRTTPNARIR